MVHSFLCIVCGVMMSYIFPVLCLYFALHLPLRYLRSIINTVAGGQLQECSEVSQYHFNIFLVLLLLCIQVTRRLYECLYMTIFSNSWMHIIHYVLGLYFYSAVGPTALLHIQSGIVCRIS